jgi:hypothetical protein
MAPPRSSNPLVPPRTSSTGSRHEVSGISTTTATSALSGPRAIEPATTCAGSLRKAESPASGSLNSPRAHASTVVTGDPGPARLRGWTMPAPVLGAGMDACVGLVPIHVPRYLARSRQHRAPRRRTHTPPHAHARRHDATLQRGGAAPRAKTGPRRCSTHTGRVGG